MIIFQSFLRTQHTNEKYLEGHTVKSSKFKFSEQAYQQQVTVALGQKLSNLKVRKRECAAEGLLMFIRER